MKKEHQIHHHHHSCIVHREEYWKNISLKKRSKKKRYLEADSMYEQRSKWYESKRCLLCIIVCGICRGGARLRRRRGRRGRYRCVCMNPCGNLGKGRSCKYSSEDLFGELFLVDVGRGTLCVHVGRFLGRSGSVGRRVG